MITRYKGGNGLPLTVEQGTEEEEEEDYFHWFGFTVN
jgi:hypothetical protein